MSEVADGSELAVRAEEASTKRKVLSMGERFKVIECLRARIEPFIAESNQAIASLVSEASNVEINWQQLKYMLDDVSMAEWKLGEKIHLKLPLDADAQAQANYEQVIALEAKVEHLESRLKEVESAIVVLRAS